MTAGTAHALGVLPAGDRPPDVAPNGELRGGAQAGCTTSAPIVPRDRSPLVTSRPV